MQDEGSRDAAHTRDRILDAAADILREGGSARVSVRAVAARAGVGVGTLRYHFPTQRELRDAVLAAIYEEAMPDERIRDRTVAPRERLLECLRSILSPVGVGDQARVVWKELFHAFIDPAASPEMRDGYLALGRHSLRRVESWLSILTEEGAIAPGDTAARARYLMTVLNGLALQRALPSDDAVLETEAEILAGAVDQLVTPGPRP